MLGKNLLVLVSHVFLKPCNGIYACKNIAFGLYKTHDYRATGNLYLVLFRERRATTGSLRLFRLFIFTIVVDNNNFQWHWTVWQLHQGKYQYFTSSLQ